MSWRSKKEHLAYELALLEALRCHEDANYVSPTRGSSSPTNEPPSHAWSAELDEKLHEIAEILKYIQESPIELEKQSQAQGARREHAVVSGGLKQHLAAIESEARRLRINRLLGKKVTHHLFRWWKPFSPNCDCDTQRLAETRMTEVDGRLVH